MKFGTMFRDNPQFEKSWERFLSLNDHASAFYTLNWMGYQRHYSEDRLVDDLSFMLLSSEGVSLAICSLYLESLRTPLISRAAKAPSRERFDLSKCISKYYLSIANFGQDKERRCSWTGLF